MGKMIEIFYDIDYGIFTIKTREIFTTKTKLNRFQKKLKRFIDEYIKEFS